MTARLPATPLMAPLQWPFFDQHHAALRQSLHAWASQHLQHDANEKNVDDSCRRLVAALGRDGWLAHAVAGPAYGGRQDTIETRSICLIREGLAWHHGLADFAFAMQGLGSGAISLFGSSEQRVAFLPRVASGAAIAAFALSEPQAGSDVPPCNAGPDGMATITS